MPSPQTPGSEFCPLGQKPLAIEVLVNILPRGFHAESHLPFRRSVFRFRSRSDRSDRSENHCLETTPKGARPFGPPQQSPSSAKFGSNAANPRTGAKAPMVDNISFLVYSRGVAIPIARGSWSPASPSVNRPFRGLEATRKNRHTPARTREARLNPCGFSTNTSPKNS
jgi:hypothetical protein